MAIRVRCDRQQRFYFSEGEDQQRCLFGRMRNKKAQGYKGGKTKGNRGTFSPLLIVNAKPKILDMPLQITYFTF